MKPRNKSRLAAHRYGIAEWFGAPVHDLSPRQRDEFARIASAGGTRACPFLQSLLIGAQCSKAGGVCSIRKYSKSPDGHVGIADGHLVTVCPSRFMQDADLLRWAGEMLLGVSKPLAVREIPFLAKLEKAEVALKDQRKAGRIDWILVHPDHSRGLRWCAVETQAVYFSGGSMDSEFVNWRKAADGEMPFPSATRRPDYRSSGPKRLAPQLMVKVPELRNWGAKTAVIVDRFFFDQMSQLDQVKGPTQDRLANAEVIWLVADYGEDGRLLRGDVVYARLDDSIRALNATQPIGKTAFEAAIMEAIGDPRKPGKKVFRL